MEEQAPHSPAGGLHALSSSTDLFMNWSDLSIAQFVARRSGVDFVTDAATARAVADRVFNVRLSIVCGDARLLSTYTQIEEHLEGIAVNLVLVDPPFGVGKHGPRESWDSEKWSPSADILGYLDKVPLASVFAVALYVLYQDVGAWIEALKPGTAKTGPSKGELLVVLGRDGGAQNLAGTVSPGTRAFVLVMKYGDGAHAVRAEDSRLQGRFQYSFPSPQSASKYGRPEVDSELRDNGAPVNPTQKTIEETRLLIRVLAPRRGAVLSVCNGTGTALVAAALEGRHAVGIDNSGRQCEWAKRRIRDLAHRESLLLSAMAEGLDDNCDAMRALKMVALGTHGVSALEEEEDTEEPRGSRRSEDASTGEVSITGPSHASPTVEFRAPHNTIANC